MSFRFPVTTQEPVKTRGRVIPVRNVYRYMAPPVTTDIPVPIGSNWRIVNVLVRYAQFGANNQYMTMNLESSAPDGAGNIIAVEWDLDGSGAFATSEAGVDGTERALTVSKAHSFTAPGTYFVTAKVTSRRLCCPLSALRVSGKS